LLIFIPLILGQTAMRELSYSTPPPAVSADRLELQVEPNSLQKIASVDRGLVQWVKRLIFVLLLGVASVGLLFLAVTVVSPVEGDD